MNDTELDEMLDRWSVPPAPATLHESVRARFAAAQPLTPPTAVAVRWKFAFAPAARKTLLAAAILIAGIFLFAAAQALSQTPPSVHMPFTVDSEYLLYGDDGSPTVAMVSTSYHPTPWARGSPFAVHPRPTDWNCARTSSRRRASCVAAHDPALCRYVQEGHGIVQKDETVGIPTGGGHSGLRGLDLPGDPTLWFPETGERIWRHRVFGRHCGRQRDHPQPSNYCGATPHAPQSDDALAGARYGMLRPEDHLGDNAARRQLPRLADETSGQGDHEPLRVPSARISQDALVFGTGQSIIQFSLEHLPFRLCPARSRFQRWQSGTDVLLNIESHAAVGAVPRLSPLTARHDLGLVVQPRFPWAGIGPMIAEMGWPISPTPLKLPLLKRSERRVPLWVLWFMVLAKFEALLDRLDRRFEVTTETRSAPKGRIEWTQYATRQMPHGDFPSVPCTFPVLRDDRHLKGATRFALEKQLQSLETQCEQGAFVHRLIAYAESLLQKVHGVSARRPAMATWESLVRRGRLFHESELPNRGRRVRVWLTAMPMCAAAERVASPFQKQLRGESATCPR